MKNIKRYFSLVKKYLYELFCFPKTLVQIRKLLLESQADRQEMSAALKTLCSRENPQNSLYRIETMVHSTRHLLALKAINPELPSIFTKELEISRNFIDSLKYGNYRKSQDNQILSDLFIQEVLDLIQSSSHYPHQSGQDIFSNFRRTFPENFSVLVRYIDYLYYGPVPNLKGMLELCEEFEQHPYAQERDYALTWMTYINALLLVGNRSKASLTLKRYVAMFGTDNLELFLQVAALAKKDGYDSPFISLAADVWGHMLHNRDEQVLEKMLRGKSVAVVGNGPQELKLGKGKEIDGHDIVVRFNRSQHCEFPDDYGAKTTIWVRTGYAHTDFQPPLADTLITHSLDLYRALGIDLIKVYHELIFSSGLTVFSLPAPVMLQVREKMEHPMPSAGTATLSWLKQLKPDLSTADVYGFSYKYGEIPFVDNYAHFTGVCSAFNYVHDFAKENMYLESIMQ